jgi:putative PIN family toxin of toxin-antitoxin system
MPLRFVLDTNVLVSALRSRHGASNALLDRHLRDPRIELQVSNALMFEYDEILHREEVALGLSESDINNVLDGLLALARRREIFFSWRPASSDADDDFLFDLAVGAGAKYVVTYNVRDLRALRTHGIEAVTPAEFLEIIQAQPLP